MVAKEPIKEPTETEKLVAGIRKGIYIAIIGIVALIVIFGTLYQIDSGQEGVLLTFGKADTNAIGPGIHIKAPLIQKIVKFDVRTQNYGADASEGTLESAASSDLQQVKMRLTVNYHLASGMTPQIYTNLGPGYEDSVIVPTVHEAAKATTAQFTAADLINKREQVRAEMENLLKDKFAKYNIVVEQVSITDFDFSAQFNTAIENKVTAEQQKQKADNDLQRIKVEADQVRTAAEGQRDAAIAQATGEAMRVKLVQEELSKSPQYVEYIKASKWNGAYPQFYMIGGSQPNLLMQLPSVVTAANVTQ
jgi:prohibitin 2